MQQPFQTAELKDALERALGFALASLTRLDGASALNFKAVRATDGLPFLVKCSPPARHEMHARLVCHLREMAGSKAVRRLFEAEAPAVFRGHDVICLAWCPGERRLPDTLSVPALEAFLDDYLAFSAAMQRATHIGPHDPTRAWHEAVLKRCTGFPTSLLARLVCREMPIETVTYRPECTCTVHGDFHHGNFLFRDDRVTGYFDLEEFCAGYPTDDLVRYFVCAAEHLPWYAGRRRRRIAAHFARAVRKMPYPREQWIVAVNALLLRKLFFKTVMGRAGFARTLNLLFRARLYRRLRTIVLLNGK